LTAVLGTAPVRFPTTSAWDIRGNSIAIEIATAQRNAVGLIRSAIAHTDQHAII
jgi:hypothetical protein